LGGRNISSPELAGNTLLCVEDGRGDRLVFIHSILDDYGLTPVEFRVYGRLARRAGAEGAREAVRNMAAGCRVSERSVQLALKFLELAGLIQRCERPGRPTVYKLLPPANWSPASKLEAPAPR
jgi:DNA-binding MarR family transcriptional regulator